MTVRELIELLTEFPPTAECVVGDYHRGLDKWEEKPVIDALPTTGGKVRIL